MKSCVDADKIRYLNVRLGVSVIHMESYGISCNYKETLDQSKTIAGYNWVLKQECDLPKKYINSINRVDKNLSPQISVSFNNVDMKSLFTQPTLPEKNKSVEWGNILGNINSQLDLLNSLAAKVSKTGNETIDGVKTFNDMVDLTVVELTAETNPVPNPPTDNSRLFERKYVLGPNKVLELISIDETGAETIIRTTILPA
jgi:hypothetical protein